MSSARFWLGTHCEGWLSVCDVPLFVSHRRLARRATMPRARTSWALDSGGFSELSMFGEWRTTPAQYVAAVRRYRDEIGRMEWAAVQDWMCEPWIVAKTGLSVQEHQRRTVRSYLELTSRAPELPWVPVLQGYALADYHRHRAMYERAGVCLDLMPLVGIGSVCRRQGSDEIAEIIESLQPLRLHGFGLKLDGLRRAAHLLASADSMAWSFRARRDEPLPGCTHRSCANCIRYALRWRAQVLAAIEQNSATPQQMRFYTGVAA